MQVCIWGPMDAVIKCTGSCDGQTSLTAERLVFVLKLKVIELNFRIGRFGINEESIFYAPFSNFYCQHFNVFVDIFISVLLLLRQGRAALAWEPYKNDAFSSLSYPITLVHKSISYYSLTVHLLLLQKFRLKKNSFRRRLDTVGYLFYRDLVFIS